jgi:hypothetical protein
MSRHHNVHMVHCGDSLAFAAPGSRRARLVSRAADVRRGSRRAAGSTDPTAGRSGGRGQGGGAPAATRGQRLVVTTAAKTDDGVFKVHRITPASSDALLYEIPRTELGKDFLINSQVKRNAIGAGYGGQQIGTRVVRWVQKGDRVLLLSVDYTVADPQSDLAAASMPAIIGHSRWRPARAIRVGDR